MLLYLDWSGFCLWAPCWPRCWAGGGWRAGNTAVRISTVVGGVWGEAAVFDQMVEMRREEAEACWVLCISHWQPSTSPALSCEPCMKWTLGSNWGKGREKKGAPGARITYQAWFSVGIFMCKECTKVMDWCDYKFIFVCNISNSWFLGIDQQSNLVARNCSTHICLGKDLLLNSTLTGASRSLFSPSAALSSLSSYKAHQEATFFPNFHGRRKQNNKGKSIFVEDFSWGRHLQWSWEVGIYIGSIL